MIDYEKCKADVDAVIVTKIVPQLYQVIDELLDCIDQDKMPKKLLVRARGFLPKGYRNTFIKGK